MHGAPHLTGQTIHASAVLVGARAVLIRGPSGSGKSSFVLALLRAAQSGAFPFVRLVADDRAIVLAANGLLIVRPAETLQGMIERRGLGIIRCAHEPSAIVGSVVDLGVPDTERMPQHAQCETVIGGVRLARLAVAPGMDPLPLFVNFLDAARLATSNSP